ncbi:extracellular solute-binding protein family 1 [Xylanimonas cellulosilytica DSM 15894]|uniref:Extracellular solute-binding protein family 1 n=1 Tax=Xylanimonas cellulosilytica (strain DSM 15894 / JCM 12276 / CECT 5975 / KCTC 9989 / LMG 20990 / NBRC 107835 / XIL07) TaxID=446471 RepID=D1BZA2_XYLCX|nr:ABC transporter substrate-binding protein [Xylanimonas cellulosilytica]ACZ31999.1 extracellular solute-binding protein family 1 [Xylanimonas cellulosilytica DSM 15894]
MNVHRKVMTGAAAAALVLAVAGCASDAEPGADGGLSGELTVACGAMDDLCQAWTEAFQDKTGVRTSFVRLSSGETVARLAAAKNSPEFDVWHGGPVDGFGAAVQQDLLEAYESPTAAEIPEKYRDPDHYWTGVYVGVLGFCSNQTLLDRLGVDVPTAWDDLLDPNLKGQVSTAHPSTSGTAFTTLWTQVTRLGGVEPAFEFMTKLHQNVLQYSKSGTAPGQIAGRGEAAVGLVFSHDCVKYQEEGMDDLVVSFPEDGTGFEVGGVALVKGGKNPDAAKAYVDWAISAEAQEIGPTVGSYQLHTNPNAASDERMVDLDSVNLVDYDFAAAAEAKSELTARFDEEIAAQPRE